MLGDEHRSRKRQSFFDSRWRTYLAKSLLKYPTRLKLRFGMRILTTIFVSITRKETKSRRKVFYSSDDDEPSPPVSVQIKPAISSQAPLEWTVNENNDTTLSRHMEDVCGINSCMHSVGGASTFILCHVEDQSLLAISFLCSGETKVWYGATARRRHRLSVSLLLQY